MRIFLTKRPARFGGGSNSFARQFARYAKAAGHRVISSPKDADGVLVIAHLADEDQVAAAREGGAVVVHRLDEYHAPDLEPPRREKHDKIKRLNQLADVTVFQSQFVAQNMGPFLEPAHWTVILNGADPRRFRPARQPGRFIGHACHSADPRKRYDLVRQIIAAHPQEEFLLVGGHRDSVQDFSGPNLTQRGKVPYRKMPGLFRRMKLFIHAADHDPCPNVVAEAILSGVPVAYNPNGGAPELVKDCGLPLERIDELLGDLETYRRRCLDRIDLHFGRVMNQYLELF